MWDSTIIKMLIDGIGEEWKKPVNDKIHTSIFGVGTVNISEMAKATLKHIG